MARELMSNEENYCFDVAGYLIVRGVLTPKEVETCNRAFDQGEGIDGRLGWPNHLLKPFEHLQTHPVLNWYLDQICGTGFGLDRGPRLIGNAAGDVGAPLIGGAEPRNASRAYFHQNNARFCQGVCAIWALADVNEDDGGFVLIPASHNSGVEPPAHLLTGEGDMGLTSQPVLKAGDLLLCAQTTLHGMRPWKGSGTQRLLAYWYIGVSAAPSVDTLLETEEQPLPEWLDELTPEQRAVFYKTGRKEKNPPGVLVSDGVSCWLEEERRIIHPCIYTTDPDANIDLSEFYFWDLCGHLVVRNVMSDEHLKLANEAMDHFEALAATGQRIGGPLDLPKPYCEPFRQMLVHPAIVQRLTWMEGSGFWCRGANVFCAVKGTPGQGLHGGAEPLQPLHSYVLQNGRTYCESVNVAWQLRDVTDDDGGFVCVPGSHKARYPMPEGIKSRDNDMGLLIHPTMKAGDVLFFMGGAQTHGSLTWTSEIPRRAILLNYTSRNLR